MPAKTKKKPSVMSSSKKTISKVPKLTPGEKKAL